MNFVLARKRLGLTQAEMAKILGVNQATICSWETGKYKPNVRIVQRVAEAYHTTVDDVLSDEESK